MPTSRAIATAVNAVKRWGVVDAGTRAAATLALSQWTAMKARSAVARPREARVAPGDLVEADSPLDARAQRAAVAALRCHQPTRPPTLTVP